MRTATALERIEGVVEAAVGDQLSKSESGGGTNVVASVKVAFNEVWNGVEFLELTFRDGRKERYGNQQTGVYQVFSDGDGEMVPEGDEDAERALVEAVAEADELEEQERQLDDEGAEWDPSDSESDTEAADADVCTAPD